MALATTVVVPLRCRKSAARLAPSSSTEEKSPPKAPWQWVSISPGSNRLSAGRSTWCQPAGSKCEAGPA